MRTCTGHNQQGCPISLVWREFSHLQGVAQGVPSVERGGPKQGSAHLTQNMRRTCATSAERLQADQLICELSHCTALAAQGTVQGVAQGVPGLERGGGQAGQRPADAERAQALRALPARLRAPHLCRLPLHPGGPQVRLASLLQVVRQCSLDWRGMSATCWTSSTASPPAVPSPWRSTSAHLPLVQDEKSCSETALEVYERYLLAYERHKSTGCPSILEFSSAP